MRVHPGLPPPYSVLLQLRFSKSWCLHPTGELLPHLFTLTGFPAVSFSVALSPGFPGPSLSANLLCEVPTFLVSFPTRSPTQPMCSLAILTDCRCDLHSAPEPSTSYAPRSSAHQIPVTRQFARIRCNERWSHHAKPELQVAVRAP